MMQIPMPGAGPSRLRLLSLIGGAAIALASFAQQQTITRSRVWPKAGVPITTVGDTLQLTWNDPGYPRTSYGTVTTMDLGFVHQDLMADRAMDLRVLIKVKATINNDLTTYSSGADHDSTFTLTFRIGRRSKGVAQADSVAPDSLLDRALDTRDHKTYACTNARKLVFELLSVQQDLGSGMVALGALPQGVYFDGRLRWGLVPELDVAEEPEILSLTALDCDNGNGRADELDVAWSSVDGAYEYHLEWTWVDDYKRNGTTGEPPSSLRYDLRYNATRVSVNEPQTHYRIPLLFDHGFLVVRVRAMGRDMAQPDLPVYGQWSLAAQGTVASAQPDNVYAVGSPHRGPINWQLTSSFAEEGKRKEVMTYADGTLRSREAVTRNNSLGVPIIGETFYDAVGRAAVTSMPVPLVRGQECPAAEDDALWAPIELYKDFNRADVGGTAEEYTYADMLADEDACGGAAKPFHPADGAELYYHPDHMGVSGALTGKPSFLPQAEGYPFTQTEFTRDNTGRVRRKSGVGDAFKLGSGHETKYLYGKPEQIKLDRLFGSEAGYASHYQKNVVIDGNGQASVSYVDMHGHTVATALAGGAPPSMTPLLLPFDPADAPSYTTDMFGGLPNLECPQNVLDANVPSLVFTDQIVVPANQLEYVFDYTLSTPHVSDACMDVCLTCVYDVTLQLFDQCGTVVMEAEYPRVGIYEEEGKEGTVLVFSPCGEPELVDAELPDLDPVLLDIGEYTLVKTVRLHAPARDAYVAELIAHGEEHLTPECFVPLDELITTYQAAVDTSDCYIDCEDCYAALGTLDAFLLAQHGTAEEYQMLLAQCDELCLAESWCTVAYKTMLVDMSYGGQYASVDLDDQGSPIVTDRASVFYFNANNESSVLGQRAYQWDGENVFGYTYQGGPALFPVDVALPMWRQPRFRQDDGTYVPHYYNMNGVRSTVIVYLTDGVYDPPVVSTASTVLFPDDQGQLVTYPENLLELADFLTAMEDGFERSLLIYHPEYCYWLDCKGYADKTRPDDPKTSDEFDNWMRGLSFVQASTWNGTTPVEVPQLINVSAVDPADRVQVFVDNGNGSDPLAFDPFGINTTAYGSYATSFRGVVDAYLSYSGGPTFSMEEAAAIFTRCGPYPNSAPTDPDCWDFGAGGSAFVGPGGFASLGELYEAEWEAFKAIYFAEKYRYQKRLADSKMLQCNGCSGVNYCIGQGDEDAWRDRLNYPLNNLPEPSWYDGLPWYYEVAVAQALQYYSYPLRMTCQACSDQTSTYYVDKAPRFPDPSQFPGMGEQVDMAYSNYMATGDCPLASAWLALFSELAIAHHLDDAVDLSTTDAWAGVMVAQNGADAVIPGGAWAVTSVTASDLEVTVTPTGGPSCTIELHNTDPVLSTYLDPWNAIFTVVAIDAQAGGLFDLHVQYMDIDNVAHSAVIEGSICGTYDLITCNFPMQGTANELGEALESLFSLLASSPSGADVLGGSNVDLSAPLWPLPDPGPSYQELGPDYFATQFGAGADWTWDWDAGTQTFTLATSAGTYPRYVITVLDVIDPVSGFDITDPTDMASIFSFQDLHSVGFNLFDVDLHGPSPAFDLLATLHCSIVYDVDAGTSIEPTVGTYGYPEVNQCEGLVPEQQFDMMQDLYALLVDFLSSGGYVNGADYDLFASPAMTDELLAALAPIQCEGWTPPDAPCQALFDPVGTLSPFNYYKQFSFGEADCPTIYAPTFTTLLAGSLGPPMPWGEPDADGFYHAVAAYNLNAAGEVLYPGRPMVMLVDCLQLAFCPCTPSGGPEPETRPAVAVVVPSSADARAYLDMRKASSPARGPIRSASAGTSYKRFMAGRGAAGTEQRTSPCNLSMAMTGAIDDFNGSTYSTTYTFDLTTGPSEQFNILSDLQMAGLCPCASMYIDYLADYTAWGGPPADPPGEPPMELAEYIEQCDYELPPCEQAYQLYLDAIEQVELAYSEEVLPFVLAPQYLFVENELCYCVDGYVAMLEHIIAAGEFEEDLLEDPGVWSIQAYCQVPAPPCDPVVPPAGPPTEPPPGGPSDCADMLMTNALNNAHHAFQDQVDQLTLDLTNAYNTQCMRVLETLAMTYQDPEYQHTLFYYDQAGQLVKTVPPEGVVPLDIGSVPVSPAEQDIIDAIADDRANGTHNVFTEHRMASEYMFNSLNNPIRQNIPDMDRMDIWELGLPNGLPTDLRVTGTHFLDGGRGYLSGWRLAPDNVTTRGYAYRTADGGASWQRSHGLFASNILNGSFVNSDLGLACGADGSILRTVDGGATWDLKVAGTASGQQFTDVAWKNSGDAVFIGYSNGYAVRTFTAGDVLSTPSISSGFGRYTSITSRNNSTYWVTALTPNGKNGMIGYGTNNVFQTITQPGSTVAQLNTACDYATTAAVVGGNMGFLMRSTDTGVNWSTIKTGTTDDFRKVFLMPDGQHGVALLTPPTGPTGLRSTSNGGETWTAIGDADWDLRDLYAYQTSGPARLIAVGAGGLIVRLVMDGTGAVGLEEMTPIAGQVLTSAWAKQQGDELLFICGTANGTVYWTPDLSDEDLAWGSSAGTVFTSSSDVMDIVAEPVGTNVHLLFRSDTGRLNAALLDLAAGTWDIRTQFGTANQYQAMARRSSGQAAVYRAATNGVVDLFDLTVPPTPSSPYYTSLVSSYPVNGPLAASNTIRALAPMGASDNTIVVAGNAGLTGYMTIGNGPITETWTNRNWFIRPLPLYDMAEDLLCAVGAQGTVYYSLNFNQVNSWIAVPTRTVADLHGVTKLDASNNIIAVGDDGAAFTMLPTNPGSYAVVDLPSAPDLNDVVVQSGTVTIAADGGTIFHATTAHDAYTTMAYNGGNVNGLVVHGSEVMAFGDKGMVHRTTGTMRSVVNDVFLPRLNDIRFSSPTDGYVVGNNLVIRHTTDGAQSWHAVPIPVTSPVQAVGSRHYNAVATFAPGGLVAGDAIAVGNGSILATITGNTFTPLNFGVSLNSTDVATSASGAVVVCGNNGTSALILRRQPGGSWLQGTYANTQYYTVFGWPLFNGREDFLVAGKDGAARFVGYTPSTDAFSLWLPGAIPFPAGKDVLGLHFHDRIAGYAVGTGGNIFRTRQVNALDHSTLIWNSPGLPAAGSLLGQTDADLSIATIGFSDRHHGFVGGLHAGTPPGYARTVHDESELYSNRFWYDELGRLIASQSTKQFDFEPKRYSYSLFDDLGRIVEAGEIRDEGNVFPTLFGADVNGQYKPDVLTYASFSGWVNSSLERYEVAKTYYDKAFNDGSISACFDEGQAENLRLRVAHTTYADQIPDDGDVLTYQHATHYSYDIHGNVKELVQDEPQLGSDAGDFSQRFKDIRYTYDLISGNVRRVDYQDGQPDQFHHKYFYDADSRIEHVETSRNGLLWKEDARYFYYPHGPLQRTEIGALKVQGIDMAYTLQGWLKGINSDLLKPVNDIGQDAKTGGVNELVARDVYGLSLGYYGDADYSPIDGTRWSTVTDRPIAPSTATPYATDWHSLYNGNIAHTVNSLAPFGGYTGTTGETGQPLAMAYTYDQLNRLSEAHGVEGLTTTNTWSTVSDPVTDRYKSLYIYDKNGNIGRADRWDETGDAYDRMAYFYHDDGNDRQRNRLYHIADWAPESVVDPVTDGFTDYPENITPNEFDPELINDPAGANNYGYDANGNLIRDRINLIDDVDWTAMGKVRSVTHADGSGLSDLRFDYTALGQRRQKTLLSGGVPSLREHYVRDAQGNIMAIYRYDVGTASLKVKERPIYGSTRIGEDRYAVELAGDPPYDPLADPLGRVHFELNDHLGNVTTTITDELIAVDDGGDDDMDYFQPNIVTAQGYEPFGGLLPKRVYARTAVDTEPAPTPPGTLVLTEFSNGPSGACEYVELYVGRCALYPEATNVDIRGWIIDDNSGTFNVSPAGCTTGVGIGAGHMRFAYVAQWADVPVGSVIVLYNGADNCFLFAPDESGASGKYIIDANSTALIERATSRPTTTDCSYCGAAYQSSGSWSMMGLGNPMDGVQVRCPGCSEGEPAFFHGYSYGAGNGTLTAGSNDLGAGHASGAGTGKSYELTGADCSALGADAGWTSSSATGGAPPATVGVVDPSVLAWLEDCELACCAAFEPLDPMVAQSGDYRFGFNGMEKDNEVFAATATAHTTEFRSYDPRVGRWFSLDPKAGARPWQSPYCAMDNSPMWKNDPKGDIAPIVIWLLKKAGEAAVGVATDIFVQVAMEKYFGNSGNGHDTWGDAWDAVDIDEMQALSSGAENLIKNKHLAAAFSAASDMTNYLLTEDDATWDGALMRGGQAILSAYLAGGISNALEKYGAPAVSKGLGRIGIDAGTIRKWTGYDLIKDYAGNLSDRIKGTFKEAAGDGYTVVSGKYTIRLMYEGGQRSAPYFRVSIDGKGSIDATGKITNDALTTHFEFTGDPTDEIERIINAHTAAAAKKQ